MKRIVLFVLTNLAVVVVLGIVASLLGVNRFLTSQRAEPGCAAGLCLIMGFGGAIISLLISKPVAKWTSGVTVINGSTAKRRRALDCGNRAPLCRQGRHRHAGSRHL
jgi:heat shock protein HtpX